MTAQARPLDLQDITGASEHVSMARTDSRPVFSDEGGGGRGGGEAAVNPDRGLTWEAAVSLREVKWQWWLLKAPPHKAPSCSMITLSDGGRENACREDMQRGHQRDKRSIFFPPPRTLEQSERMIICRFFFFPLGPLFTIEANIRAVLCLSIIMDAKAVDGWMG